MIKCGCGGYMAELGELEDQNNPCICKDLKIKELEKQIEACKKGSDDYLNLMEIEHLRKQNEELIEVLLLTLWRLVNDSGVTDTVFVSDREKEFETLYERIESVLKEAE